MVFCEGNGAQSTSKRLIPFFRDIGKPYAAFLGLGCHEEPFWEHCSLFLRWRLRANLKWRAASGSSVGPASLCSVHCTGGPRVVSLEMIVVNLVLVDEKRICVMLVKAALAPAQRCCTKRKKKKCSPHVLRVFCQLLYSLNHLLFLRAIK